MAEYTIKINERSETGKKLLEYLKSLSDVHIQKVKSKATVEKSIIKGMKELKKGETHEIETLWDSL
jgi:hypothetical protein